MALTEAQKRLAEKNRQYWSAREAEQLRHNITDEEDYDRELQRIYSDMLDACQSEINGFYGKYASKEGITIAEAKKRVSQLDIAAYERKAKKYVKGHDFSDKANEEMRLYNATMKINRLEMLKANIGLELISGHNELEKFMEGILQGRTEDELKRQAGILGKTVRNNAAKARSIVNASFHNAKFSDRIWLYQDLLKEDLSKLLQSGLIQGKNPRVLAKEIRKAFQTSTYNSERLMRTELARVQTDAQKQSFERNGFETYQFIVNHGCCDICEEIAKRETKYGKGVYLVEKMQPGENAPPMHPHCRCSTAAYEDDAEYEAWLDYLDKGGTTEEWNSKGKVAWQKQKAGENPTGDSFMEQLANKELSPHWREYDTFEEYWAARKAFSGEETEYLDDVFGGKVEVSTSWGKDDKRKIAQIESTLAALQKKFPMNPSGSLEYATTVRRINVCDYDDAHIYLPDGAGDRRIVDSAIGQVFENDGVLTIAFSRNWMYQTLEEAIEERARAISSGRVLDSVNAGSPQTVAAHEWGHVVSNHITNAMIYDSETAHEYWRWYKSLSKDEIRNGLSDYAATNRAEFEAECFAELQMPNPRPLAVKYGEYLAKAMEEGY